MLVLSPRKKYYDSTLVLTQEDQELHPSKPPTMDKLTHKRHRQDETLKKKNLRCQSLSTYLVAPSSESSQSLTCQPHQSRTPFNSSPPNPQNIPTTNPARNRQYVLPAALAWHKSNKNGNRARAGSWGFIPLDWLTIIGTNWRFTPRRGERRMYVATER